MTDAYDAADYCTCELGEMGTVERLVPGCPVHDPYDEPMIGGPHEVTNQYHSEPDRDPRQT